MFLKQLFLLVCGLSFGFLASAGVFTVLVSVGLIPRFAGKMHVARKIFALEEAVVFGTVTGGLASIFPQGAEKVRLFLLGLLPGGEQGMAFRIIGTAFLILFGLFAGMFVGCLAFAIAEMLNSIPIFARRIGFRHGLGVAICFAALGKLTGSLLYFAYGIFQTGM